MNGKHEVKNLFIDPSIVNSEEKEVLEDLIIAALNDVNKKIAENTKSKDLISIVGGGDTIASLKNTKLQNSFTHLSTAGGAFFRIS